MSKYLITGVTGFVGRYFVEYLQKHEPDALIYGIDRASACDLDINHTALDLCDAQALNLLLKELQPDYVLHLASISSVGQSWQNPTDCFKNNTDIMLNLLEAVAKNSPHSRILSIGSSEEYGNYPSEKMPLTEDMPLNPQNPYAVAKVSQELLCKLYAQSMNIDVVMTRSFNHIGPRQSDKFVVPSFIKQLVEIKNGAPNKMLVGNIKVKRDFLDVRDVVDAYYKLLHTGKKGEVYNVCSGKAVSLQEIIKTTSDILDITPNIEVDKTRLRPNDTMLVLGCNDKLSKELGWQNKCVLTDTIRDIIRIFNNERYI